MTQHTHQRKAPEAKQGFLPLYETILSPQEITAIRQLLQRLIFAAIKPLQNIQYPEKQNYFPSKLQKTSCIKHPRHTIF